MAGPRDVIVAVLLGMASAGVVYGMDVQGHDHAGCLECSPEGDLTFYLLLFTGPVALTAGLLSLCRPLLWMFIGACGLLLGLELYWFAHVDPFERDGCVACLDAMALTWLVCLAFLLLLPPVTYAWRRREQRLRWRKALGGDYGVTDQVGPVSKPGSSVSADDNPEPSGFTV